MQQPSNLSPVRPETNSDTGTGTGETEAERNNRNLADLLQELRVAGLGVQVLFGFLLALPFTQRFTALTAGERHLYRASVLCAALSIALLVSPVAYHRWVFRRHVKGKLLKIANVEALIGLATVSLSVCTAVWLVLLVVGLTWIVGLFASLTTGCFVVLWFVLPVVDRITAGSRQEPSQTNDASHDRRTGVPVASARRRV
jgi:hypothetical protein